MNKQETIQNLADEIAPVISEYLQETIAWQTDGNKFCLLYTSPSPRD